MKTWKKISLGILGLLILFQILREFGFINLDFEMSSISSSYGGNIDISKQMISEKIIESGKSKIESNDCNYKGSIKNVPIEIRYKSKSYGVKTECKHILIDITKLDYGVIWTPLIKKSKYNIVASFNCVLVLDSIQHLKITKTEYKIKGDFKAFGNVEIYGFCSYRNAKKLIIEQALVEIHGWARDKIK